MSQTILAEYFIPVKVKVQATKLTDEQLAFLCQENPELRLTVIQYSQDLSYPFGNCGR